MTRTGKGKKTDKDDEEERVTDATMDKAATLDNASGEASKASTTSATIDNVLTAIASLSSNVDKKISEVNSTLIDLKSTFADINVRLTSTEDAVQSHEERLSELEKQYGELASDYTRQLAKLDDLEARSRRQNIRIVGIKEKAEAGRPTEFIAKILPEILGIEHFDKPIKVDRAHRGLKPAQEGKSRPIIARLHDYNIKELVMRLSRQKSPLTYSGATVHIFPDLTSTIIKKRNQFNEIKEKCKVKRIRYGFRHPAKFIVTVNDVTETFDTPADAERFLKQKVTNW